MRQHDRNACRFCRADRFGAGAKRGRIRAMIADALGLIAMFAVMWGALLIGHGLGW